MRATDVFRARRDGRHLCLLAFVVAAVICLAAQASAAVVASDRPRIALVVGVSQYDNLPHLKNPLNDADLIADTFKSLGFDVLKAPPNPTLDVMEAMAGVVKAQLRDIDNPVFAFYFAGQGAQIDRRDMLFLRDTIADVKEREVVGALDFMGFVHSIQAENPNTIALYFIDSCRENPFRDTDSGTRAAMRLDGQRSIATANGTFFSFASDDNAISFDGDGKNSPYATALARHLVAEDLSMAEIASQIRVDVVAATRGRQIPRYDDRLSDILYMRRTDQRLIQESPLTRAGKVLYVAREGQLVPTYEDGSYALLVGVSDYDDALKAWNDLPAIEGELAEVGDALERYHDFEVETVINPTGRELVERVSAFVNRTAPLTNARVVLYFSGHGMTTLNPTTKERTGWFVPRDAPRYQDSRAVFSNTALNMSRVMEWLSLIEAKHVLWVFDSCFSGEALRMAEHKSGAARPYEIAMHLKSVRRIITAGSADQEVPAKSRFTEQFTRILRGEVKVGDQDDMITGDEIGDFLKRDLIDYSHKQGRQQTPQSDTVIIPNSESGDIVFRIEPELLAAQ